ncbi:PREDICTED: uncharacterized protein LOC104825815 [Tarenaya hassleriana]|uniref:uncharacterized protein LOC104825815 n=1 Tax=Tarenaya hassleriana TaxID=28532 RepID=UPI00053C619D|nr:PREDICTED: uncharacterized protein LOC104825815 [Tarenaya hassleriana]
MAERRGYTKSLARKTIRSPPPGKPSLSISTQTSSAVARDIGFAPIVEDSEVPPSQVQGPMNVSQSQSLPELHPDEDPTVQTVDSKSDSENQEESDPDSDPEMIEQTCTVETDPRRTDKNPRPVASDTSETVSDRRHSSTQDDEHETLAQKQRKIREMLRKRKELVKNSLSLTTARPRTRLQKAVAESVWHKGKAAEKTQEKGQRTAKKKQRVDTKEQLQILPSDSEESLEKDSEPEDLQTLVQNALSPLLLNELAKERLTVLSTVDVIGERNANVTNFKENGVWDLLENRGLTGSVTYACPYSKSLIREFYANLTERTALKNDIMFHKVYVRGRFLDFSPALISRVLGTPEPKNTSQEVDLKNLEVTLTGEYDESRDGQLTIAQLLYLPTVLHKVARTNWVPTKKSDFIQKDTQQLIYRIIKGMDVNLGQFLFEHIMERKAKPRKRYCLPYPCLIQTVLIRQCPELLTKHESTEEIPSLLIVDIRDKRKKATCHLTLNSAVEMLEKTSRQLLQMEIQARKQAQEYKKIRIRIDSLLQGSKRGEDYTEEEELEKEDEAAITQRKKRQRRTLRDSSSDTESRGSS